MDTTQDKLPTGGGTTITGLDKRVLYFNGDDSPAGDDSFIFDQVNDWLKLNAENPTGLIQIGRLAEDGTYGAIWFGQASPDTSNYSFLGNTNATFFNVKSGGSMGFRYGNNGVGVMTDYKWAFGYTSTINTDTSVTINTGSNPAYRGLVIMGAGSQSANLQEWRNNSNVVLALVDADGNISVPDEAFGSGWDGSTEVATKNAIYDKMNPLFTGQTYTPTNVSTDRSYDANATTTAELADVLGTLIADLQSAGIIN